MALRNIFMPSTIGPTDNSLSILTVKKEEKDADNQYKD
jgi:hypothetical protein